MTEYNYFHDAVVPNESGVSRREVRRQGKLAGNLPRPNITLVYRSNRRFLVTSSCVVSQREKNNSSNGSTMIRALDAE